MSPATVIAAAQRSTTARGLFMLVGALLFMVAVHNTRAIDLQSNGGGMFLVWVAIVFAASTLLGATLRLEHALVVLLLAVFVLPLTRVTETGSYNVTSAGLFFGLLIQLRTKDIRFTRPQKYLFASLIVIGIYFNIVPVLFDGGDGFDNKLWLYNFSTFVKYAVLGMLVVQSRIDLDRLTKWVNVIAITYAALVLLDAYHVPAVNLALKTFSGLGHHSGEFIRNVALNYFRSSGIGYDPNHAGVGLALLLVVSLATWRRYRLALLGVPLILAAVFLTGSRAATILSLVALCSWVFYQRDWSQQIFTLVKWGVVTTVIVVVGLLNTSFARTAQTAANRNIAFVTSEGLTTDASLLFRIRKVTERDITVFGDRTEHLSKVHSEFVRVIRFYGLFGVIVSFAFWSMWLFISRRSYLGFTLVLLLFMTMLYRWTWHIEAAFIPVLFIAVLAMKRPRTV